MSPALILTKAVLAIRRVPEARGFSPEYITHQVVADLFPDRTDRGYLFRVTRERPGGAEVLVLSGAPPRAADEIPIRPYGAAVHVQQKVFAPRLALGQVLDFEVRLNATTSVAGKRTDVWDAVFAADRNDPRTPHNVYRAFLARKLEGAAEVLDARVTARGQVTARRGDRDSPPMTFIAANVIGTLRVQHPDHLLRVMSQGVGRAKAFGYGLLCLSRPGTVLARHGLRDEGDF